MTVRYAKDIPQDKNNQTYPALPAYVANQSQMGVPIASSVISLTDNTTVLDVTVMGGAAGNAAIIGKWGPSSVTSSNYDFVVQSGQNRTFIVPVSIMGVTSNVGINKQMGLYNTVSVKVATAQSASVFTVEF